jgi:glucose-6-phosphate 1-epimerase
MPVTMTKWGALPALRLAAADGAEATVTLYGAQLVSWRGADGGERLFCSARSARDGSRAIRGGVPVIFPQFAERGAGMRHGFARVCHWQAAHSGLDDGAPFVQLRLTRAELPAALAQAWPFKFALSLRITLRADSLDLSLQVRNMDARAFPFAAALHAYYQVAQLDRSTLDGLAQAPFSDHTGRTATQREATLHFDDHLDRIYRAAPGPLTLDTGTGALRLEQQGFTDVVVWNPGARDAAALADLADDEVQRFVCVEPAGVDQLELAAGAVWRGGLRIRIAAEDAQA